MFPNSSSERTREKLARRLTQALDDMAEDVDENLEQVRRDLYAETRRDLLTRQLSNSERFDGAILTLSTTALGVSLAFIKDIVPLHSAKCVDSLVASWWLFRKRCQGQFSLIVLEARGKTAQIDLVVDQVAQHVLEGAKQQLSPVRYGDHFGLLRVVVPKPGSKPGSECN